MDSIGKEALQIFDIVKIYSDKKVVNIPELTIDSGRIVSLMGNNGAGKTTLFRLILDLVSKDNGVVFIRGLRVAGNDHWKKYIASYLGENYLIDYLTPEEYFYFIGKLRGFSKAYVNEKLNFYSGFFNHEILGQRKYIRDFSTGNRQKIGIISCLIQEAKIIILDEPFANLDPISRSFLKEILTDSCKKNGITCLISSHDITDITEIAHRLILMENGLIIKDTPACAENIQEIKNYFIPKK